MPLNANYPVTYNDTTGLFQYIINTATDPAQHVKNFRILIYNGDVDTVCNFLGDAWHMDNIANLTNLTASDRMPWVFRNQYAGYHQPYSKIYNNGANTFTLDVLTVKGSGHFVPNDKQGPSLQMITNFIRGSNNYNSTNNFQVKPSPQPGLAATDATASTTTPIGSNITSPTTPASNSTATTMSAITGSTNPTTTTSDANFISVNYLFVLSIYVFSLIVKY
uniref:Serine carboxypeptidase n=1 Tax=Panagrolaimus davidi TaxID=227884 RepID=A0A914PVL4_9BILA